METNIFEAGVQYNDYKGSVAADRSDDVSLSGYLRDNGKLNDGETLKGIEVYVHQGDFTVYIIKEEADGSLKKFDSELTAQQFFEHFKRFSITLSSDGNLEGQEITYERI